MRSCCTASVSGRPASTSACEMFVSVFTYADSVGLIVGRTKTRIEPPERSFLLAIDQWSGLGWVVLVPSSKWWVWSQLKVVARWADAHTGFLKWEVFWNLQVLRLLRLPFPILQTANQVLC